MRPAPWSKAEVLDRLGDDEDLLRELCGIFLSESPKLLEKLREAIAEGEAGAVMRAAHSLKGEVSYLSAPAATEDAGWLEDMGHNHDISRAPEVLLVLEREMEHLVRAIREFARVQT
jgi:HPt (histidine-containing phosphotransfer) domain-containing protein